MIVTHLIKPSLSPWIVIFGNTLHCCEVYLSCRACEVFMYEGMIPQSGPIQIKDCVQPRQMVVMRGFIAYFKAK
jgi:hypothetical protein